MTKKNETPNQNRSFSSISEVLENLFKKKKSPLSSGYFICQLVRFWEEIAGAEIANTGYPVQFKDGELTIALPSSSHLHEMHFVKEALRSKINKKFPEREVKKIILKVGNKSSINKELANKIT